VDDRKEEFMESLSFGALARTLLGLSSLGCLAFMWSPPVPSPGKSEGDLRILEPVTYENLTLFPVLSSQSQDTHFFLTLDEGLASGDVIVREQGSDGLARSRDGRPLQDYRSGPSVNQLVLINRGKRPLLLLAGELVSGGKQDRIIAKDRIIAPGAEPLALDVFCVEHGRWSSGAQFSAAKTIVHPSVREKAAIDQEQTRVWSAVRSGTTAQAPAGAPAPRMSMGNIDAAVGGVARSEAYDKIYQSSAVGVPIDSFVEEVEKRFARATSGLKGERVVGVVVAYGGEVAWSDIFASGDLFEHYRSKLLRSYAVEALARPALREKTSINDAREFLRPLHGVERQESLPGVYRWRETTEGRLVQIELDALQPRDLTLHSLKLHRTS
jgi:hypothetical protein